MRALDNNQSVTSNFDCVIKSTNTMVDSGLYHLRKLGILTWRDCSQQANKSFADPGHSSWETVD